MNYLQKSCLICGAVASVVAVFLYNQILSGYEIDVVVYTPTSNEAVVIIDAGHGGEDGGAVSPMGTIESTINLSVAQKIDQVMGLFGVHTELTRDSDSSLHDSTAETLREKKNSDLKNRVAMVESIPNAVLISVHQNMYQSASSSGAQVFYRDDTTSQALAIHVQGMLKETLDSGNNRQATQIPSSVYLMNHISCPAILVECGFLSNSMEDALLQTKEYQTKLALTIASAYFTYEGTIDHES